MSACFILIERPSRAVPSRDYPSCFLIDSSHSLFCFLLPALAIAFCLEGLFVLLHKRESILETISEAVEACQTVSPTALPILSTGTTMARLTMTSR